MHKSTWKAHERDVALALGGVRVPITGRGRGSAPDVEVPGLSVEVKSGRVLSARLRAGMQQAIAAIGTTGKVPIVVVVQPVARGQSKGSTTPGRPANEKYVLLRLEDFLGFYKGEGNASSDVPAL